MNYIQYLDNNAGLPILYENEMNINLENLIIII